MACGCRKNKKSTKTTVQKGKPPVSTAASVRAKLLARIKSQQEQEKKSNEDQ